MLLSSKSATFYAYVSGILEHMSYVSQSEMYKRARNKTYVSYNKNVVKFVNIGTDKCAMRNFLKLIENNDKFACFLA